MDAIMAFKIGFGFTMGCFVASVSIYVFCAYVVDAIKKYEDKKFLEFPRRP